MNDLTDEDVSRKVALKCGWTETTAEHPWNWRRPDGSARSLPAFASSLDACRGPGGPLEFAFARGWGFELSTGSQSFDGELPLRWWQAGFYQRLHVSHAKATSPERAVCDAFLAAVEVAP